MSFRPLFIGDWIRAVFIHYEVDAGILQRDVPFELDLFDGRSFVSLVAFTMERLRPSFGGRLAALLFRPIANHRFFNVRTYVRHKGEAGIYFIAEFLSNPLCVPLGPPTFGLPYRFGDLDYRHQWQQGIIEGRVATGRGQNRLQYTATPPVLREFRACQPGTLDAFLLERYTAFTQQGTSQRFFRIFHPAWPQISTDIAVADEGLLATTGRWASWARVIGANVSPGVCDVQMSWPQRIETPNGKRQFRVFFEV